MSEQQPNPVIEQRLPLITKRLGSLRRRARVLLVAQRLGAVLAALVAVAVVAALLDYVLRAPIGLRTILWIAAIVLLGFAIVRRVLPAARFNPNLAQLALRVERSNAARESKLRGTLASGVEFAGATEPEELTRGLQDIVIQNTRTRFATINVFTVLDPRRAARSTAMLMVAGVVVASFVFAAPTLTTIGAKRVLLPWTEAQWPKRTAVIDATGSAVHPLGQALPLRAAITRTNQSPGQTPVWVRYRTGDGPITRVPLTAQNRPVPTAGGEGELFERLIEIDAESETEITLEYWFETDDDRTESSTVLLVEAPAIESGAATVVPPAYATDATSTFSAGPFELGAGNDERALVGPVLAGSRIALELQLNKPIPVDAEDRSPWLAAALGLDEPWTDVDATFDGASWSLAWIAREPRTLRPTLVDEHGLTNTDEPMFGFDVQPDREPTATLAEPPRDENVLASALIDLVADGRDDVGLEWIAIERQLAVAPPDSEGAPPEPAGQIIEIAREQAAHVQQTVLAAQLDLTTMPLHPGDEVWIQGVAKDGYLFEGESHEPSRSGIRVLRIIDEHRFVEQMRNEMIGIRRNAMRLDEDQSELQRLVQRGAAGQEAHRRQQAITERVENQRRVVEQLQQRIDRNRLDDPSLSGMLDDAEQTLRAAANRSSEAAGSLGQAAEQDQPTDEQLEQIDEQQEQVREELAQLIELLDRGEDGWVVRRAIEQLAEQQQRLMEQTQSIGEQTMGRSGDQLTAQEQSELDRIAARQADLAEQAQETIDEMSERSRDLAEHDPALAQAMKTAAQRARQNQVSQKMQQAGQQAQQNQTSQAGQSQQEALDALEDVLDELDNADKKRDEALKRQLADIIATLESLIRQQRAELAALGAAEQTGVFDLLDDGLIKLHSNTIGSLDTIRVTDATIASIVEDAGDKQTDAIILLRNDTLEPIKVRAREDESLSLLIEAKEAAEKMMEEAADRENARRRAELRKAYRDALEEQVVLRTDAGMFHVEHKLSRRERAQLRGLGERQQTLRARLGELHEETEELKEAKVFDFAHKRLDKLTGRAGDAMRAGEVRADVLRAQDSSIRILQGLADALKDDDQDQDFREEQQQQGGGSGGSPPDELLPQIGELKLLRAMQDEAAILTRILDNLDSTDLEIEEVGVLQRNLADHARELIQKMSGQAPGSPADLIPEHEGNVR